jgi:hypothetical protein
MQGSRFTSRAVLLLGLAPASALAHGGEVILFPVGTLLAIGTLIVVGRALGLRWPATLAIAALAFTITIPLWVMPGDLLPSSMEHIGWGYFLQGFVPCILAGGLVMLVFRAWKARVRACSMATDNDVPRQ